MPGAASTKSSWSQVQAGIFHIGGVNKKTSTCVKCRLVGRAEDLALWPAVTKTNLVICRFTVRYFRVCIDDEVNLQSVYVSS